MSHPPGVPGSNEPPDPWGVPSGYAGQPPYGYGQPSYPPPTNGKAQAALWTGIGMLVLAFCCGLGVFGFIPVILGIKARSEIRASGGHQEGDGMALAGIVTGAVAVVLSLLVIVALVALVAVGSSTLESPYTETVA